MICLVSVIICANALQWTIENEPHVNLRDGALIVPTRDIMPVRGMLVLRITLDYRILEPAIEKVFLNEHVKDMVKSMGADLANCLPKTQKIYRKKRGAFNLGGEVLKGIFGTATEKDLRAFQSDVQEHLNTHTIEIVDLYHINNETQDTLALVSEALNKLNNETKYMNNEIDTIKMVVKIKTLCDTLHDITTDLEMGHVHLNVFNQQKVLKLVEYYSHRWNLQTLVDRYSEKFQTTLTSSVISQTNVKIGLIMIPFFPEEQFVGYKVLPLPMFTNTTNKHKIELTINHNLIIFSQAKDKVFLTNTDFLTTCHKSYDNKIICPNFPLLSMSGQAQRICEVNLIANNNSTSCKFTETDRNYLKIIEISNAIIVSANPNESVQLYCKDKEARPQHQGLIRATVYRKNPTFQIPSSGIAVFPPTCRIVSKNIEYNPLLRKTMAMEFFYPKTLTNDIIQTHDKHPAHRLIEDIRRSINHTRRHIQDERHLQTTLMTRSNVKHISISLSTFGSIGILCMFAFLVWRHKNRRRHVTDNNTTDTNINVHTVPIVPQQDSDRSSLNG